MTHQLYNGHILSSHARLEFVLHRVYTTRGGPGGRGVLPFHRHPLEYRLGSQKKSSWNPH